MNFIHVIGDVAIVYVVVEAVVVLVHPRLMRDEFAELSSLDFGAAGFFLKPTMAFLTFLLFFALWPIAWFNAGKSEKKRQETWPRNLSGFGRSGGSTRQ